MRRSVSNLQRYSRSVPCAGSAAIATEYSTTIGIARERLPFDTILGSAGVAMDVNVTATSARYDPAIGRIVVLLNNGERLELVPADCQGLENATPRELSEIEISPSGRGIHFPLIAADLYVPALVQGVYGSKAWMARKQGRKG